MPTAYQTKPSFSGDNRDYPVQMALSGRLVTAYDSTKLVKYGDRNTVLENFKVLRNMKYTDNGIKGVAGMSKINSTPLGKPLIRNIHQFTKNRQELPPGASGSSSENHLLVQAYDSNLANPAVYKNDTIIPNAGSFNAIPVFTDNVNAKLGRFSNAPQGHMAYCNGVDTMVWGGDETQLSSFIIYAPDDSFRNDYTSVVQNSLDDTANVATIKNSAAGIDGSTVLLLHCDELVFTTIFTDSSASAHVMTAVGNCIQKTTNPKFGPASGYCDGTGGVTTPDHADFDFSGGAVTLDGWFDITTLASDRGLMGQGTDAERYWQWYVSTDGSVKFKIFTSPSTGWVAATAKAIGNAVIPTAPNGFFYEVTANNGDTKTGAVEPVWPVTEGVPIVDNHVTWTCRKVVNVTYTTAVGVVPTGSYAHLEFDESGDAKYLFVNGVQKAYYTDTNRIADMLTNALYTNAVNLGAKPALGYFDEVRISKVTRHTKAFDVPTSAYGNTPICSILIGDTMPIQGYKIYVKTANTGASTHNAFYHNSTGWVPVTNLVDNTSVGGVTLKQTGTVTFDSTENVASVSVINGVLGYWYKVEIANADETTTISHVTLLEPFQRIKDFWDGDPRTAASVQLFTSSAYQDNTVNVLEDRYIYDETVGGDTSSYMVMDSIATATDYLVLGFNERQMGINIKFIPKSTTKTHVNTTAGTFINVLYNDSNGNWVAVTGLVDGTINNNVSAGKSGFITWNPLADNVEFKKTINLEDNLYYYKLQWSQNFSADVKCYYISGIPAQKKISNYKFPMIAKNSLWLFGDTAEMKNKAIVSRLDTFNVFNGKNSGDPLIFGDEKELTAAAEVFVRYTSAVSSVILVCKTTETYVVDGDTPDTRKIIKLSDFIGCIAPLTLESGSVGLEYLPLQAYQVAIFQGSAGIYIFNGTAILPISDDIANYFDQSKAESINPAYIDKSEGWFSYVNGEVKYHWSFASGSSTTLNKELVFDLRRQKWYEIDRGKYLQCATAVRDTTGNNYAYGCIDTGYVERLDNGMTFDGGDITSEFQTPDLAVYSGTIMFDTLLKTIELPQVVKTNTPNSIAVTHWGDTSTVASTPFTLSPKKLNARISIPMQTVNYGNYVFHTLNFKLVTNNETVPFEPLYLGVNYKVIRHKI